MLPAPFELQGAGEREYGGADAPPQHVGGEAAHALVVHEGHLRAGERLQPLAQQVRDAACAVRAPVHLARMRLHVGDEFLHVPVGHRRMRHHHGRALAHLRDRREVAVHVIGQVLVEGRCNREAGRNGQQRVAIGPGLHHQRRAERGACARLEVDDEGLAQRLGELLVVEPRLHVAAAAGSERVDDRHRPRRIGIHRFLREGCACQCRQRGGIQHRHREAHDLPPIVVPAYGSIIPIAAGFGRRRSFDIPERLIQEGVPDGASAYAQRTLNTPPPSVSTCPRA